MTKTTQKRYRGLTILLDAITLVSLANIIVGFLMVIGCEDPITMVVNYTTVFVGIAMMVIGVLSLYAIVKKFGDR